MTDTADRLREAALHLFSEQGYRETTVGDLEAAAGLAPRAGGFYRHFESKEALMVDLLEAYFEEVDSELGFEGMFPLSDTKSELLLVGRVILNHAARHRPFRLMLRREGRNLPAVRKLMKRINQQGAYRELVPWLERKIGMRQDLESMTASIFGTIFYLLYTEDHGDMPLGLDRESILESWATSWAQQIDQTAAVHV